MISVVLAAGYATRMYPLTESFPKPLLPVGGQSILDRLLQDIDAIEDVHSHVLISNHKFIGHFERWAAETRLKKPLRLLDDGSTDNRNRLGAVRDVLFAIESLGLSDDLLVVAGDNLLTFSLDEFVAPFTERRASQIMCYLEPDMDTLRRCGVMLPGADMRVLSMEEKPEQPKSHWAVPPFYIYAKQDLPLVALGIGQGIPVDAPGSFIAWLCQHAEVYAVPMPGKRIDVGDLQSYQQIKDHLVF